jgi:hypothetical protein
MLIEQKATIIIRSSANSQAVIPRLYVGELIWFKNEVFSRSSEIDSQPGGIASSQLIPGLHKRLQMRALIYKKNITASARGPIKGSATIAKSRISRLKF